VLQLRFDGHSTAIRLLIKNHQWRGLRPSILGQDRSQTTKSVLVLVLVSQVWCFAVKHDLVTQPLSSTI